MNTLWSAPAGRELDSTPLDDSMQPIRIVACLNVWNDITALKQTMPTWMNFVHHIIAVDGAYEQSGHELSTDGTRDYLRSFSNLTLIDSAGVSQCEKRTRYLSAGREGDLLFIIDADESIGGGEAARMFARFPSCDVGWVTIESSLYARSYGQPRFFRWIPGLQYRGRHHWIYDRDDRLVATHQYGGTGYIHRPIDIQLINQRRLGRSATHLTVKHSHHEREVTKERVLSAIPVSVMSDSSVSHRESLQILHIAYRDDGMAPSRLHTAINRTTPHRSIFAKTRPGPFDVPDQYLASRDAVPIAHAMATADVLHFHGVMSSARGARSNVPIVFHHHGTLFRTNAKEYNKLAKDHNALILLSNLELFSWVDDCPAYFLPNTVPVGRYATLAALHRPQLDGKQLFRIAHSPSKPERKGTDQLLKVCAHLQSKNYPIEVVMIHDQTHRDSLRMKATCHAMFDSFWLGMQCSGIEAAAMGMPVIAGDVTVRDRYVDHFGECPFTFAVDEEQLETELQTIVEDEAYRAYEAQRVFSYVRDFHDESAVALKYLDLLDLAFDWRTTPLQPKRPSPVHASQLGRRRIP